MRLTRYSRKWKGFGKHILEPILKIHGSGTRRIRDFANEVIYGTWDAITISSIKQPPEQVVPAGTGTHSFYSGKNFLKDPPPQPMGALIMLAGVGG